MSSWSARSPFRSLGHGTTRKRGIGIETSGVRRGALLTTSEEAFVELALNRREALLVARRKSEVAGRLHEQGAALGGEASHAGIESVIRSIRRDAHGVPCVRRRCIFIRTPRPRPCECLEQWRDSWRAHCGARSERRSHEPGTHEYYTRKVSRLARVRTLELPSQSRVDCSPFGSRV